MKLEHKNCANCGNAFDNNEKGMTAKVWARRKYCSRKCGASNRVKDFTSRGTIEFDIDDPVFMFVSGRNSIDIRAMSAND